MPIAPKAEVHWSLDAAQYAGHMGLDKRPWVFEEAMALVRGRDLDRAACSAVAVVVGWWLGERRGARAASLGRVEGDT